jgi:hypothetical protein
VGIDIQKHFFEDRADVPDDLEATAFWPTTFVSGPSPGLEVHWHAHDVHAYGMEGHTSFLDGESGKRHPVGPGDKIVVSPRTLHAEGEVADRVVYVIAAPEALPPEELLKRHAPDDL